MMVPSEKGFDPEVWVFRIISATPGERYVGGMTRTDTAGLGPTVLATRWNNKNQVLCFASGEGAPPTKKGRSQGRLT